MLSRRPNITSVVKQFQMNYPGGLWVYYQYIHICIILNINDTIWPVLLSSWPKETSHHVFLQTPEAMILFLLSDHLVLPGLWPKAAGKQVNYGLSQWPPTEKPSVHRARKPHANLRNSSSRMRILELGFVSFSVFLYFMRSYCSYF